MFGRAFRIDEWAVAAALVTIVVLVVRDGLSSLRVRELARMHGLIVGIVVLGAVFRHYGTEPALLHAEFRGPLLVTDLLRFFDERPRFAYGPAQYFVLGGLAQVMERSAEGIFLANQLVHAFCGMTLAMVATRLFGDVRSGVHAALLHASSPVVARLACSEDAHGVGLLFGLVAVLYLRRAARDETLSSRMGGVASTFLMLSSRESYYAWVPMLYLLADHAQAGNPTRGPAISRGARGAVLVACALYIALVLLQRVGGQGVSMVAYALVRIVLEPRHAVTCLKLHPVVDLPSVAVALLACFVVGLVVLVRRPRDAGVPLAICVGLAATFVATFVATWPSLGVRWAFRFPFYALYLLVAAHGSSRLALMRAPGPGRVLLDTVIAMLLAALGLFGGAARANRSPDPEYRDYAWLRDTVIAAQRQGPVGLVSDLHPEPAPLYAAPAEVARVLGIPYRTYDEAKSVSLESDRMWLYYEGLGCTTYSLLELLPEARTAHVMTQPHVVDLLLFGADEGFGRRRVSVPEALRPTCLEARRGLGRTLSVGPSIRLHDDPPFALHAPPYRFRPRMSRLRPSE